MRPCSESIAQLASALAKAQTELVNPAKTLTGVIDRWGSSNEGQSYRYAPLSAGLDIVRKTLCRHELAVIQTTHVDQQSAMVMLTTTLAHGSGEWIAASWPVCRTSDMTNPKLMGAALTYARRYGLFTLIGMAGEDDLDAPELPGNTPEDGNFTAACPTQPAYSSAGSSPAVSPMPASPARIAPGSTGAPPARPAPTFARPRRRRRDAGIARGPRRAAGAPEDAVHELHTIRDANALFEWALAILPLRNKLDDSARRRWTLRSSIRPLASGRIRTC